MAAISSVEVVDPFVAGLSLVLDTQYSSLMEEKRFENERKKD